jgi:hypothetical protein
VRNVYCPAIKPIYNIILQKERKKAIINNAKIQESKSKKRNNNESKKVYKNTANPKTPI